MHFHAKILNLTFLLILDENKCYQVGISYRINILISATQYYYD